MAEPRREKITKTVVDGIEPDSTDDVVVWDTQLKGFRVRVRPSGRKVYEVRYRSGSRQRLFTIGTHGSPWTADKARAKALTTLSAVEGGEDPQADRDGLRRALTVSELIAAYLEKAPADKPSKRQSSWRTDRTNLVRHLEPLLGRMVARDLTPADLSEWQAAVAAGKTAVNIKPDKKHARIIIRGGAGAAARAMRSVAAMLAWAKSREIIDTNPAERVEKFKDGRRERYLTDEEAARLWSAVCELEGKAGGLTVQQAVAFKLLMLTGARRGEILGLRWSEVDLRRSILLLPPSRHKSGGAVRPKAIPLPQEAVAVLRALPRAGVYVLASDGVDAPMVPPKKAWKRALAKAEVTDASFHVLRHTLASFAIADGASLYVVGKALGHSKPETTQRYAHLRDDVAAKVAESAVTRYIAQPVDSTDERSAS